MGRATDLTDQDDLLRRFMAKVQVVESGCWEWQGWLRRDGYGIFAPKRGFQFRAHRWYFEAAVGPIPEQTPHLDHLCRNRRCVNPAHLEPVTQAENNRRAGMAKSHCIHGHEYTAENVYVRKNGARCCRLCVLAAQKRERSAA